MMILPLIARMKRNASLFGLALSLLALLFISSAFALEPDEILVDAPQLEQRARNLSSELRCVVCQNQNIDESDATIAKDMRLLLRQRLLAGDSDAQVKDFFVTRYGDFVLFKPRWSLSNAALWLAPFITLALGLIAWFVFVSNQKGKASDNAHGSEHSQAHRGALSAQEEQELAQLLRETTSESSAHKPSAKKSQKKGR